MKKEFKTEITSVLSYSFEISEDGIYMITISASCKPGWRNSWWLTLKGFLENILDLHQFDWALGAGKTDTGIFPQYKGFLVQLKAGARIFKEAFQELKEPPFVHKNVDGKPLTVLNRATYALYRYTPHIAGADIFYRVYAQFFDKDDLGGKK